MWLRPWTNGPIPGCKCGHTFTGQHNRTICHRVQVYTCSSTPEPTSTFSLLVPPESSKTIYRFQKPHSLLFVHMSKSIWYTFLSNHLYKHHNLSKHLFIQFESQQGIFFSLMVSFGVIVAHRRNTHWHSLPVKFVELIQKLDLRRWLSVCFALCYHSFMICIYKCLPFCVFVTKNDHFLEKVNWAPCETHKMGTFSIRSVSQFQHRA